MQPARLLNEDPGVPAVRLLALPPAALFQKEQNPPWASRADSTATGNPVYAGVQCSPRALNIFSEALRGVICEDGLCHLSRIDHHNFG